MQEILRAMLPMWPLWLPLLQKAVDLDKPYATVDPSSPNNNIDRKASRAPYVRHQLNFRIHFYLRHLG
jgi:hypothetical protein